MLPAALPGIVSAFMLAISRAIGETMIVVMAAGLAANLTLNPLDAVTTITVQIKTILVGDQEFDSAKTLAAFALGFVLFFVTLILNFIALRIRAANTGNSMTDQLHTTSACHTVRRSIEPNESDTRLKRRYAVRAPLQGAGRWCAPASPVCSCCVLLTNILSRPFRPSASTVAVLDVTLNPEID